MLSSKIRIGKVDENMKSIISLVRWVCPVCDTEFVPTYGYQKYCSQVCRVQAEKVQRERYRERNGG